MNVAGVMTYAYRAYGDANRDFVRRAIGDLELPYDPLPTGSVAANLSGFISQVPVMSLDEMLETRRVGLLLIDEDSYSRSTEHLRRVDLPEGDTWLEALSLPDGYRLISPQLRTEVAGLYLIGPVAEGPELTRLVTLDTGIRPDSGPQPAALVLEKCDKGVDKERRWICLQGSCTGHCEPDGWTTGRGPARLTGCSCL